MKRHVSFVCVFVLAAFGAMGHVAAQTPAPAAAVSTQSPASTVCPKTWVGHETEVEAFLRTAPIVSMTELPIGVTKPKRAYFAAGGPVASAAWKPLSPGVKQGYVESYKAEIAAYELDKALDMHMVPPYVERRVDGDLGAIAFWVENVHPWEVDHPVRGPDPVAWDRQVVRMKMFDQLIGNIDRNQGNLLYDDEYHLILIDHSRAFTGIKDVSKLSKFSRVDRELWQKMLALDEPRLEAVLGQWVDKGKRKAILQRRDEMKKEVDSLIAQKGEPAVFLPPAGAQR